MFNAFKYLIKKIKKGKFRDPYIVEI